DKIDIKVTGPTSVGSGEEVTLAIAITNNNDATLTGAELFLEYPDGTRDPSDITRELRRERIEVGTIGEGQRQEEALRAVFFGAKNDLKAITMSLDFTVENSNAVYTKTRTYDVKIDSSPITLTVDSPSEINAGQE